MTYRWPTRVIPCHPMSPTSNTSLGQGLWVRHWKEDFDEVRLDGRSCNAVQTTLAVSGRCFGVWVWSNCGCLCGVTPVGIVCNPVTTCTIDTYWYILIQDIPNRSWDCQVKAWVGWRTVGRSVYRRLIMGQVDVPDVKWKIWAIFG